MTSHGVSLVDAYIVPPNTSDSPMRCFRNVLSARQSTASASNMMAFGDLALACLLLLLGLSGHADAARPREQRLGHSDPYIVSPPGSQLGDNIAQPPKDLGTREFVS